MIVQCAKCHAHYENGMPPIALSATGHFCPFEPVVIALPAPPTDASGGVTEFDIAFLRDVANWLTKESDGSNPSYEMRSEFLAAAANAVARAADRARKLDTRRVASGEESFRNRRNIISEQSLGIPFEEPTRAQAASTEEPVACDAGYHLFGCRMEGDKTYFMVRPHFGEPFEVVRTDDAAPAPVAAYREVTIGDARSYRAAFSAHRELHTDVPVENSALAALRSIGAVILMPKDSTPNYDAEGAMKIPDPELPH